MDSNTNILLYTLAHDSFIQVNKRMLKILKGDAYAAIILHFLIGQYRYYKETNQIKDGWFFQKQEDIKSICMISEYIQRRVLKYLKSLDFIDVKIKESPPKRFIRINFDNIADTLALEKLPQPHALLPNPKIAFYKNLNEAVYINIEEFKKALHNISSDIGEFLFAWSRLYRHFFSKNWKWDSRQYGIINQYWRAVYKNKKPFDYGSLIKYFLSYPEEASLQDFIKFSKNQDYDIVMVTKLSSIIKEYPYFGEING